MEYYKLTGIIDNGCDSSITYSGIRTTDGLTVTIKVIPIGVISKWVDSLPMECYLLLQAQRVVGCCILVDYFNICIDKTQRSLNNSFIIVVENLQHYITLNQFYNNSYNRNELIARNHFKKIVKIVLDLYKLHIIHGNINLENITIDTHRDSLRLNNFRYGINNINVFECCNTINNNNNKPTDSALPERESGIFCNTYTQVWQLGHLLSIMCIGRLWFEYTDRLTEECNNLLELMLEREVHNRITLHDIINHPWCKV